MGRKEVKAKYELRQAEQSIEVTFNLVLENLKSVAPISNNILVK